MQFLVGDIGGTSSRFAWMDTDEDGAIQLDAFIKFKNTDFKDFVAVLHAFLDRTRDAHTHPIRHALIAIAGPLGRDGGITLTNNNYWKRIMPLELSQKCGIDRVSLVNDFAAMARAIPEMKSEAFVSVRKGKTQSNAPIVVTGPGTGFGVATLIPNNGYWHVLTGEGGHATYTPRTLREVELANLMAKQFGYISVEMIVAGAWTQTVFNFICDLNNVSRETVRPADILERAKSGEAVCAEFCRLRARAIMGALGDLVLINGALGGAILTGSVAEHMVDWLTAEDSLSPFIDRGSHSNYMANVPVDILTEPTAPLIGAGALLLEKEGLKRG